MYVITLLPIILYLVIYYNLKKSFLGILSHQPRERDITVIDEALKTTRFFFIIICQYQILKTANVFVKYTCELKKYPLVRAISVLVVLVSEIAMLIGTTFSINKALAAQRASERMRDVSQRGARCGLTESQELIKSLEELYLPTRDDLQE